MVKNQQNARVQNAHVIVLGNEKGGSGKSTTAFHLSIFLCYQGFKVATIDADSRQHTLTSYVRNRRHFSKSKGLGLPSPVHFHLPLAKHDSSKKNSKIEFGLFGDAIADVERTHDFLIIDTAGYDNHATRIVHSMADTLVTPLNDSLIDFDVLAQMDPVTQKVMGTSHYSRLVQAARKERLMIDGSFIDWVLVRNRVSTLSSRNMRSMQRSLDQLSMRLGCRVAQGLSERVIFRSLFQFGLTVFDSIDDEVIASGSAGSQIAARQEYQALVKVLNLPLSARAQRHTEARQIWAEANQAFNKKSQPTHSSNAIPPNSHPHSHGVNGKAMQANPDIGDRLN